MVGLLTGDSSTSNRRAMQSDLFRASIDCDLDRVVTLLNGKDVDINRHSSKDCCCALHLACAIGHSDVVSLLLERGVDIESRNDDKQTPLHHSIARGHREVTMLLLKNGASVQSRDGSGRPALHCVCIAGDAKVVKYMRRYLSIIDIDTVDNRGSTALHYACSHNRTQSAILLMKMGADITKRDATGRTALHLACSFSQPCVVSALVDRGADIEDPDDTYGMRALHYASYSIDTVLWLIAKGADVTSLDWDGLSPLDYIASGGDKHKERVLSFIRTGADMHPGVIDLSQSEEERKQNLYNSESDEDSTDSVTSFASASRELQGETQWANRLSGAFALLFNRIGWITRVAEGGISIEEVKQEAYLYIFG